MYWKAWIQEETKRVTQRLEPGQINVGCPGIPGQDGPDEFGKKVSIQVSPSKGKDSL